MLVSTSSCRAASGCSATSAPLGLHGHDCDVGVCAVEQFAHLRTCVVKSERRSLQ